MLFNKEEENRSWNDKDLIVVKTKITNEFYDSRTREALIRKY